MSPCVKQIVTIIQCFTFANCVANQMVVQRSNKNRDYKKYICVHLRCCSLLQKQYYTPI